MVLSRTCRSPTCSHATAAIWRIDGCEEHVGAFRDFLREHGQTPEEQELVAAKLMGRWRSGAPLVLAPNADDAALGADMQRNNDFNYKEDGPARVRRAAWRALPADESAGHGGQYESAANDSARRYVRSGARRNRAAGRRRRTRNRSVRDLREALIRQFEFAQNVWINDKAFPRARQRARSDHRHAGRYTRIQDPEATDQEADHRASRRSRPSGVERTSSCPGSRRSATWPARVDVPTSS